MAVRSEGGKPSASLYADEANETLLASSNVRGTKTDCVAVDFNHPPTPGAYHPKVRSKAGDSPVELDNDLGILGDEPIAVAMTESDVVISTDVFLEVGVDYVLSVKGAGDAALFLMLSDAADSSTWYQGRKDAAASADAKGASGREKITVIGTGDWHGLILINNSGTYTVKKTESTVS